jgi:hypothetical protein
MNPYWIGLAVVVAGILFLVLGDSVFGLGPVDTSKIAGVVALGAILIVILPQFFGRYGDGRSGSPLTHVAIWLGIIAVLVLVYQYREVLGLDIP